MDKNGKNANSTVCVREDCTFYSKSTKTCDYRLHTGVGRGMPVDACDKYTTDEYRRKRTAENAEWTKRKGEACMESMAENKAKFDEAPAETAVKPEKTDWDRVFADMAGGMSPEEAATAHGITVGKINQVRGIRESRAARKEKPADAPAPRPKPPETKEADRDVRERAPGNDEAPRQPPALRLDDFERVVMLLELLYATFGVAVDIIVGQAGIRKR